MRTLPLVLTLLLAGCPDERLSLVGADADADGFHSGVDCNDDDDAVNPGATEVPYNGVDDDCDEATPDDDVDGDGSLAADDCDDTDAKRFPGATETCNGVDDDCDEAVDEDLGATWYADVDGDGYGDPETSATRCDGDGGAWVHNDLDCDDALGAVHPGADEECNDRDDDCDGAIDTDAVFVPTWYHDVDGDLFGNATDAVTACDAPANFVANPDDCNDALSGGASVHPGATELCNAKDDDCDGTIDVEAVGAPTFFLDHDEDGFGSPDHAVVACAAPALGEWVVNDDDCYDFLATAKPGGTEVCNGIDDDCDGTPDDAATNRPTWHRDLDGDGFGDPATTQLRCDDGGGDWVLDALDCDDSASTGATAFPGGDETCDGRDNDCNDVVDDVPSAPLWFLDFDEDGFGDALTVVASCDDPSDQTTTWVADSDDCDDLDPDVNPDAAETCDLADQDCDGLVDDGATPLLSWYLDADDDGYGDTADLVSGCSAPTPEYISTPGDCDDLDDATHPNATQTCSFVDNDCVAGGLPTRTSCTWGTTCIDVLQRFPQWAGTDANFLLDPEGNGGPVQYLCDMTPTGGPPGAGWMRIAMQDFEDSSAGGWQWDPSGATGASTPTVTTCGTYGKILAVPAASSTAGGIFFRTFSGLPHDEVWITHDYIQTDTWDGEYSYLAVLLDPDSFEYLLAATTHTAATGTSQCGGATADTKYTVTEHALSGREPLEVRVGSTLNQAPSDESFGFDNMQVWIR